MHSGLSTEAKAGGCPAEFPKLLCKDGNATRRKLRNCGNATKQVQAETPKLLCKDGNATRRKLRNCCAKMEMLQGGNSECYQAGAGGNRELHTFCHGFSGVQVGVHNIIITIYIFKYKTRTPTHTKPIPVHTGTGTGFSEIPPGYLCSSLGRNSEIVAQR